MNSIARPFTGLPERCAGTLREIGSSIFFTSLTDFLAFMVGSTLDLPAIHSFCITAGIAVLAVFCVTVTMFLGLLVLDAKRVEANRYDLAPCLVREREPSVDEILAAVAGGINSVQDSAATATGDAAEGGGGDAGSGPDDQGSPPCPGRHGRGDTHLPGGSTAGHELEPPTGFLRKLMTYCVAPFLTHRAVARVVPVMFLAVAVTMGTIGCVARPSCAAVPLWASYGVRVTVCELRWG